MGRGGMGEVFRVRDAGQEYALKRVQAHSVDLKERFLREARILLALIPHPGIVAVHEVSQGPPPYFTMDLVQGHTLDEWARERKPTAPTIVHVFSQLARAVQHLHAYGVFHRDLAPWNIMVRTGDVPVLIDFGLATAQSEASLTRTGQFLGNPKFASPEQHRGDPLDARSEVYSLGLTLKHVLDEGHSTDLERLLHAVAERCVSELPEDRYPSAGALADALRKLTAPTGPLAPVSLVREKVCFGASQAVFLLGMLASYEVGWLAKIPIVVTSLCASTWVYRYASRFYVHFAGLGRRVRFFLFLASLQLPLYALLSLGFPSSLFGLVPVAPYTSWLGWFCLGAIVVQQLNRETRKALKRRYGLIPGELLDFLAEARGKQRSIAWILGFFFLFTFFGLLPEVAWLSAAGATLAGGSWVYRDHLSLSNVESVLDRWRIWGQDSNSPEPAANEPEGLDRAP